jgi:hypothetical protein
MSVSGYLIFGLQCRFPMGARVIQESRGAPCGALGEMKKLGGNLLISFYFTKEK